MENIAKYWLPLRKKTLEGDLRNQCNTYFHSRNLFFPKRVLLHVLGKAEPELRCKKQELFVHIKLIQRMWNQEAGASREEPGEFVIHIDIDSAIVNRIARFCT
ncbi:hypothetical protein Trydic_g17273 [Trypoxylus dichotomus]